MNQKKSNLEKQNDKNNNKTRFLYKPGMERFYFYIKTYKNVYEKFGRGMAKALETLLSLSQVGGSNGRTALSSKHDFQFFEFKFLH